MSRVHAVEAVRIGLGNEIHLPQSAVDFMRLNPLEFVHVVQYSDGRIELAAATCPAHQHYFKRPKADPPPTKLDIISEPPAEWR
jgi:hypothetical protein